ncbi:MAG TPA: serine/threonine-protein kinase, partial [Verrucomicrobium sp.]|nr:serine/threonine-protein kinase [Verrucomicrobium sp.]
MNTSPPSGSPSEAKKCVQCGALLPAGRLEGLCAACLLQQGVMTETPTHGGSSSAFEPPALREVARLFPQLEILAFIGRGGMGAVYKARQPALDRFVALKLLAPQRTDSGFAERFGREARALAKLVHPNIVAVHDFGQVEGWNYIIMEFVDGVNLRQLERAGRLSPREALQIVPQVCDALQFAHDNGIVHRDIKP